MDNNADLHLIKGCVGSGKFLVFKIMVIFVIILFQEGKYLRISQSMIYFSSINDNIPEYQYIVQ